MNPPPQEGGFYHIDVTENTITYTLMDNTGATDVVIPEGRTDAYYLFLPNDVESVEVVSSDNIIVTATIAEAGPSPTIIDMFGSGLVFPETLGDNVIYIEIQVGTDLSEVGQQIKINYSLKEDQYICASGPLLETSMDVNIWNIFTDSEITQGASIIYDFRPGVLADDVEFPLFPMNPPPQEGGFYHIDLTLSTITYTLMDNTGATDVVIPEGRTDAYYLFMPSAVKSVEVVSSDNIIVTATIAEAGASPTIIDMFGSGLVFPETLGDNVIYIEIQVGTDLSELAQQIKINYSLK